MAPFRVVLDTNVFISTFILHGRSTRLAQQLFDGKFTLLVSEPILEEYFGVAIRPRFKTNLPEVRTLLEGLGPWMRVVPYPKPLPNISISDMSDLKFLECAVGGGASHLVTGDHVLLRLKHCRRVAVISIASFLRILDT